MFTLRFFCFVVVIDDDVFSGIGSRLFVGEINRNRDKNKLTELVCLPRRKSGRRVSVRVARCVGGSDLASVCVREAPQILESENGENKKRITK